MIPILKVKLIIFAENFSGNFILVKMALLSWARSKLKTDLKLKIIVNQLLDSNSHSIVKIKQILRIIFKLSCHEHAILLKNRLDQNSTKRKVQRKPIKF